MNFVIKILSKIYNACGLYKIKIRYKIKKHLPNSSRKELKRIYKDYLQEREFGFTINEYFAYGFPSFDNNKRREFISDLERIKLCDAFNLKENKIIFDDKSLTYKYFKDFYKRDVMFVKDENDKDSFIQFVSKHHIIIVKPVDGSFGCGIQKFEVDDKEKAFAEILKMCKHTSKLCVVEEVMENVKEFGEFHSQSLNTIRICTIRMDDRVEIIAPFARIGVGNSIVDNAGSGGIIGSIDIATGKIFAAGNEFGEKISYHPDSNKEIIGFAIPRWDEVINIAKQCAQVIPTNRYVGWDFALPIKDG